MPLTILGKTDFILAKGFPESYRFDITTIPLSSHDTWNPLSLPRLPLWTHAYIRHAMVACRWIASIPTGHSSREIRRSGKKMADTISWRDVDHINSLVFLPALQSDTDGRAATAWIPTNIILGTIHTLYSLLCTLPIAGISPARPSLSGLRKNLYSYWHTSGKTLKIRHLQAIWFANDRILSSLCVRIVVSERQLLLW